MKRIFIYSIIAIVSILGMRGTKQLLAGTTIQSTQQQLLFFRSEQQELYCQSNKDKPCIRLPHQQSQAARLWLQVIQTVGKETTFRTPYYEQSMQKLFTLSPYRIHIHREAIMLGLHAYDMTQQGDIDFLYAQGQKLIPYICDEARMQAIVDWDEQDYISTYNTRHQSDFQYACEHYQTPALLGFIAYYYQQNIPDAIQWYRIASMSPDTLDTFMHMPALLTARYDERSTSLVLWYQRLLALYDSINTEQSPSQAQFILEQIDYITNKMIETATLITIQTVNDTNECQNDILCVQENIAVTVSEYNQRCQIIDDISDDAFCFLRNDAALQQQIISLDHPSGTDREYTRRADQDQWGVQFISSE